MIYFFHVEIATILAFVFASPLTADTSSSSSSSSKPFSSSKAPLQTPTPKKDTTPKYHPTKLEPKPAIPPMTKPFGMPGVIGFQNGKWQGTDYLGFLTNNIGIDVEILKSDYVPQIPGAGSLSGRLAQIFEKENINPHAESAEGLPLPFFHVLILIYPIDKDKFALLGNGRLFEQVQIMRKDFLSSGYWQAITWETQDTAISTGEQLDAQVQAIAERLATAFAERYRQYQESRPQPPS